MVHKNNFSSPPPEIILIAAMAANRVIGREGKIPWHLPEELRYFKATTMGHPLVMGRRTWDSIGRPLPGRRSIVITRNPHFSAPGAERAASIDEALERCRDAEKIFVIGGAEIFAASLPRAYTILLTVINRDIPGDTFFPPIPDDFVLVHTASLVSGDEHLRIETYRRRAGA